METTKKQNTFRGKTIEDLKSMDVREFAKLLASIQKKYLLRNFQETEDFLNRANKKISKNKPVKTHKRDLVVVPGLIGMKLHIHNGRAFTPIEITWEMLGHKFGEFSPTRGRIKHGKAGLGATKGSKAAKK